MISCTLIKFSCRSHIASKRVLPWQLLITLQPLIIHIERLACVKGILSTIFWVPVRISTILQRSLFIPGEWMQKAFVVLTVWPSVVLYFCDYFLACRLHTECGFCHMYKGQVKTCSFWEIMSFIFTEAEVSGRKVEAWKRI